MIWRVGDNVENEECLRCCDCVESVVRQVISKRSRTKGPCGRLNCGDKAAECTSYAKPGSDKLSVRF